MNNTLDIIKIRNSAKLTGAIKLTSNGDSAKTVKINILANSGGVCYPGPDGCPMVFDFDGMIVAAKIPLDYNHDQTIGYLNRFDWATGQLSTSGVISLIDIGGVDVNAIVQQMADGVPYEASIEAWPEDDMSYEYIPEGATTVVNKQTVVGPMLILRKWTLKAVAICKFGADYGNTQVALQLSNEGKIQKNVERKKGLFIHLSNKRIMETEDKTKSVTAVEAGATEANEIVAVEVAPVEATEVTESEVKAEAVDPVIEKAKTEVEQTEANESEAVEVEATKKLAEPVQLSTKAVEAKDDRSEFRLFLSRFGKDKGTEYYADRLSISDATDKHVAYLTKENADLKKRLSSVGRGMTEPVKFSDSTKRESVEEAPKLIRMSKGK